MRVFISYRRADLGGHADALVGRIYDRLSTRFGKQNVCVDVETIPAGEDFAQFIGTEIAQADAVLAVIGPQWPAEMRRRAGQDDYVRMELQAALRRRKVTIPVLIGGAAMPAATDVPEPLQELRRMNACPVSSGSDFHSHLSNLIAALEAVKPSTVIECGRFRATKEADNEGNIFKYVLYEGNTVVSYGRVLDLWEGDGEFRTIYCSLLTGSGFSGYVWEAPPLTRERVHADFEFVLLNAPKSSAAPDPQTYAAHFDIRAGDHGVVTFENLGKDALLIVPSPHRPGADYGNLAAFFQNAPTDQHQALWRVVGRSVKQRLVSHAPLWLSVAGGGVAWLHVRLDSSPKYYRYGPYRIAPDSSR